MMLTENSLKLMQKMLQENYKLYISDEITEKEYLTRIKPIDQAIDKIEMAILLQGSLACEIPSLEHLR